MCPKTQFYPTALMQTLLFLIFVLATIVVVAIAANRFKLPPAIVMVLAGLLLAVRSLIRPRS
jgi:Kef-type K+ transport system membrane component KefB